MGNKYNMKIENFRGGKNCNSLLEGFSIMEGNENIDLDAVNFKTETINGEIVECLPKRGIYYFVRDKQEDFFAHQNFARNNGSIHRMVDGKDYKVNLVSIIDTTELITVSLLQNRDKAKGGLGGSPTLIGGVRTECHEYI